jgi:hypothetical protein
MRDFPISWITSSAANMVALQPRQTSHTHVWRAIDTKGADVASMDLTMKVPVRLFHPRSDKWNDHFQIAGDRIEPLTSVGEATVRLLRLNSTERLLERRVLRQ